MKLLMQCNVERTRADVEKVWHENKYQKKKGKHFFGDVPESRVFEIYLKFREDVPRRVIKSSDSYESSYDAPSHNNATAALEEVNG